MKKDRRPLRVRLLEKLLPVGWHCAKNRMRKETPEDIQKKCGKEA
jgi:hypothetical protein